LVRNHRFNRSDRPSLRNGVNGVVRALPGVRDLIVTVARKSSLAHLAPAQGRQDHTPPPSALDRRSSAAPPASIAARFTFVTTRPPLRPTRVDSEWHNFCFSQRNFFDSGPGGSLSLESTCEFRSFAQSKSRSLGPRRASGSGVHLRFTGRSEKIWIRDPPGTFGPRECLAPTCVCSTARP
jgi:hypothetical protein